MFGGFGIGEISLIAGIILLLFGGKKLPELARGMGKGVRIFKKEMREIEDAVQLKDVLDSVNEAKHLKQ
ncbi:MAG: twin-arginine translocase TatA/TatE family subunit [Gemmatimonadetes bacterium]|nr:MAG: twin-arginine translocase TatA/TatE family subunit [Gemmatimonadota bacterium]